VTAGGEALLVAHRISKRFGAVRALSEVSLAFHPGEVHAVVGENGAGKSTLTKIIGGALKPDEGSLEYLGQRMSFGSPLEALAAGISVIFQELSLTPQMSVAANVFLGHEPRSWLWRLDKGHMRRRTNELLERLGARFDADARVRDLSTADRQLVEIAAALNRSSRLIIMDEPTASLPEDSAERLFGIIEDLRADGVCIIYISHELDDVFRIADRITVLKDGTHVVTSPTDETTKDAVIAGMVGRAIADLFPPRGRPLEPGDPPVLAVRDLTLPGFFEAVDLDLHRGEIVGLAGLIGAGRTALARALFGAAPGVAGPRALRGRVLVDGSPVKVRTPRQAIRAGLAYVPEERKSDGLALELSITTNVVLPQLRELARRGVTRAAVERRVADQQVTNLAIRCSSVDQHVDNLSGGNQQKVVLSRWLARECRVLILDDPTRGVDVGAKVEIYRLVRRLTEQNGVAVLLISSELPEILGLCDRVLIMRKGRVVGEEVGADLSEEAVIRSAFGAVS
jgi:ABC-type sugar transport system ATPase subunit